MKHKSSVRQKILSIGQNINLQVEKRFFFTNFTSDRGLISKICKEHKKLDTKNQITQFQKWRTDLISEFSIKESQMPEKHVKKCSTFLSIREIQIKTIFYLSQWVRAIKQVIAHAGRI